MFSAFLLLIAFANMRYIVLKRIIWLVLPVVFHFSMVVYWRKMLSEMLLNDRELTVFSSGS